MENCEHTCTEYEHKMCVQSVHKRRLSRIGLRMCVCVCVCVWTIRKVLARTRVKRMCKKCVNNACKSPPSLFPNLTISLSFESHFTSSHVTSRHVTSQKCQQQPKALSAGFRRWQVTVSRWHWGDGQWGQSPTPCERFEPSKLVFCRLTILSLKYSDNW